MSIERIGVVSARLRQRAGAKLIALAILEGRKRDLKYAVTDLPESNVPAQHFFRQCGFRAGRIAGPLLGWFGSATAVAMRRPVLLPTSANANPKLLR